MGSPHRPRHSTSHPTAGRSRSRATEGIGDHPRVCEGIGLRPVNTEYTEARGHGGMERRWVGLGLVARERNHLGVDGMEDESVRRSTSKSLSVSSRLRALRVNQPEAGRGGGRRSFTTEHTDPPSGVTKRGQKREYYAHFSHVSFTYF